MFDVGGVAYVRRNSDPRASGWTCPPKSGSGRRASRAGHDASCRGWSLTCRTTRRWRRLRRRGRRRDPQPRSLQGAAPAQVSGARAAYQLRTDGVQPQGAGRADRGTLSRLGNGIRAVGRPRTSRPASASASGGVPLHPRCGRPSDVSHRRRFGLRLLDCGCGGAWALGPLPGLNLERCLCLGFDVGLLVCGVSSSVKSRGGPPRRSSKLIAMKPGR
jgi:hypothetical protein